MDSPRAPPTGRSGGQPPRPDPEPPRPAARDSGHPRGACPTPPPLGTLIRRLLVICKPVSVTAGAGLVGDRERQKETERRGEAERDKERQRETPLQPSKVTTSLQKWVLFGLRLRPVPKISSKRGPGRLGGVSWCLGILVLGRIWMSSSSAATCCPQWGAFTARANRA